MVFGGYVALVLIVASFLRSRNLLWWLGNAGGSGGSMLGGGFAASIHQVRLILCRSGVSSAHGIEGRVQFATSVLFAVL